MTIKNSIKSSGLPTLDTRQNYYNSKLTTTPVDIVLSSGGYLIALFRLQISLNNASGTILLQDGSGFPILYINPIIQTNFYADYGYEPLILPTISTSLQLVMVSGETEIAASIWYNYTK